MSVLEREFDASIFDCRTLALAEALIFRQGKHRLLVKACYLWKDIRELANE